MPDDILTFENSSSDTANLCASTPSSTSSSIRSRQMLSFNTGLCVVTATQPATTWSPPLSEKQSELAHIQRLRSVHEASCCSRPNLAPLLMLSHTAQHSSIDAAVSTQTLQQFPPHAPSQTDFLTQDDDRISACAGPSQPAAGVGKRYEQQWVGSIPLSCRTASHAVECTGPLDRHSPSVGLDGGGDAITVEQHCAGLLGLGPGSFGKAATSRQVP